MPEIREFRPKPDPEVIEMLEDLLIDAKSGKLQGAAVVLNYTDALTGSAWAGMGKCNMAIIGELRALETDLIHMLVDLRHTDQN